VHDILLGCKSELVNKNCHYLTYFETKSGKQDIISNKEYCCKLTFISVISSLQIFQSIDQNISLDYTVLYS